MKGWNCFEVKYRLIIVCQILLLSFLGCATTQEGGTRDSVPFTERVQTQRRAHLEVSVAIPSRSEEKDLFAAPLSEKGIQAIWIRIKNYEDTPYMFLPLLVDPNYFPPYEVIYKFRQSNNQDWYAEIEEKSIHHFIKPRSEVSGFIFTNLVHGTRRISIGVVGHGTLETFVFYIQDPGMQLDYEMVDFENLYPPERLTHVNDAELHAALENLPCCTTSKDGAENGDPLNIVVIGDVEQVVDTFIDTAWDETEILTPGNMVKAAKAFISGSSYRHTIISPLYCFGRVQDLSMQKPRKTVSARNHLRLWMTSMMYKGVPVWVGQISRDVGVRTTLQAWPPFTHKISPAVDEAREYLVENMVISNRLAELGFVSGVGPASPANPRKNLTGDPYFTDGLRAVLVLSKEPTPINEIKLLKWDWPPEYSDLFEWIFEYELEE